MNPPLHLDRSDPIQLEYRRPGIVRQSHKPGVGTHVIGWIIGLGLVWLLVSIYMPTRCVFSPQQAKIFKCSSNLKNIAAAMIEYSNKNNGHYPDRIEDFFVSSGMTSDIFVCPESHDVRAAGTPEEAVAMLTAGGHCSYIYMGKGLTSDAAAEVVLAYEPLANHGNKGMNVLWGDFQVEFLDAKAAQAMLKSIVPGKPLVWPPGSATVPATQGS